MASNYTENLGLCQWAAEDPVLREDFNADNQKLEAAILAARTNPACVTGTYTGGASEGVSVELGFRPSFLIVLADFSSKESYSSSARTVLLAFAGCCAVITRYDPTYVYPLDLLTDTGFAITSSNVGMNSEGITYHYAAFY